MAGANGTVEVQVDGKTIAALSNELPLSSTPVGRVVVGESSSGRTFHLAADDVTVTDST